MRKIRINRCIEAYWDACDVEGERVQRRVIGNRCHAVDKNPCVLASPSERAACVKNDDLFADMGSRGRSSMAGHGAAPDRAEPQRRSYGKKSRVWWMGWVAWGLMVLFGLILEGCGCASDANCPNKLRCGPGGACMYRCFPGSQNACVAGFVCNATGDGCVAITSNPDAGIIER